SCSSSSITRVRRVAPASVCEMVSARKRAAASKRTPPGREMRGSEYRSTSGRSCALSGWTSSVPVPSAQAVRSSAAASTGAGHNDLLITLPPNEIASQYAPSLPAQVPSLLHEPIEVVLVEFDDLAHARVDDVVVI